MTAIFTFEVVSGSNLTAKDYGKSSDPYIIVNVPEKRNGKISYSAVAQSNVQKKSLNPYFSTICTARIDRKTIRGGELANFPIVVEVFDWNLVQKHEFMGRITIPFSEIAKADSPKDDVHVPLRARSADEKSINDRKEKVVKGEPVVGGTLKVSWFLEDPELPEEELAAFEKQVQVASDKIKDLHRAYVQSGHGREITSVDKLVAIFKETGVLEACLQKWNRKPIDTPHWDLIKNDREVMDIIFKQFFDAFDSDHSGSVNFAELLAGLNLLLHGTQEDTAKLHFGAVDINKDGNITKDEARAIGKMTIAVIKAAFMLGIRTQKEKMREAGLRESDFVPICDAITSAFEKHDLPGIEAEMLFRFADKDGNGLVSEAEYVAWFLDPNEQAAVHAAMQEALKPVTVTMTANLQAAMMKLLQRIARGY